MWRDKVKRIWSDKKTHYFVICALGLWLTWNLYQATTGIMQGDSGIYFTFCKNFFKKPFSYSDGIVSYGATSPLFCTFLSLIYHLVPGKWFLVMKLFSIMLMVASAVIANFIVRGNAITFLGITAGLCACKSYIFYSSGIFETGLICFAIALLILLLMQGRFVAAIYLSGILYLIRPELALVTAGVDLLILFFELNKKKYFVHMVLSAIPLLGYTVYMTLQTGRVLPSSVSGRILTANGISDSFVHKWLQCIDNMWREYKSILKWILLFAVICFFMQIVLQWKKKYIYILVIMLLVFLPHMIVPSPNYVIRYTIGAVPILMICLGYFIELVKKHGGMLQKTAIAVACIAMLISNLQGFKDVYSSTYSQKKFDILFGKDLQEGLEQAGVSKGTILLYEIQHQYFLDQFRCISMDAIVGSQMLDYLEGRERLSAVVRRENIDYIVCHQSALTRLEFKDTEIQELYRRGMEIDVGQTIEIDGIIYKKILENSAPTKPYQLSNVTYIPPDDLWVYGSGEPWEGGTLFWQTVYEVIR